MRIYVNYVVLLVILFVMSSCKDRDLAKTPSYLSNKIIPDWNMIYPLLKTNAQEWDPDAGLRLAVLEINSNSHLEEPLVNAFFETPEKKFDYLHIQYLRDGSIKSEIRTHGVPISNFELIYDNGWALNSTDAWDLFLQAPDVISFAPEYFECATLVLINRRLEHEDEHNVLWELAMDDCSEGRSTLFFIDAGTGELVGKESH